MAAAQKRSKPSVRYGEGGDHCGVCAHFIAPKGGETGDDEGGACQLVEGEIREDMWCKLFKRRSVTLARGEYR